MDYTTNNYLAKDYQYCEIFKVSINIITYWILLDIIKQNIINVVKYLRFEYINIWLNYTEWLNIEVKWKGKMLSMIRDNTKFKNLKMRHTFDIS